MRLFQTNNLKYDDNDDDDDDLFLWYGWPLKSI